MIFGKVNTKYDKNARLSCQRGVTLLEMLITLAIAAIVLTVVAPNIQSMMAKNRVTAEINEVSSIIQYARFTAIDQKSTTVVCPSANYETCSTNWDQAKIVFIDANDNGNRDSSEPLLMSTEPSSGKNVMTGPNASIEFLDTGASNVSNAIADTISLQICPNSKDATLARALLINQQGRVRISTDSNDDGVHEDASGDSLDCN